MRRIGGCSRVRQIQAVKAPAGVEHQSQFADETLFWRHAKRQWLADKFGIHSCKLVAAESGLFTDLYQFLPGKPLQSLAHAWNRFWLRSINLPRLAYHNILIFQKFDRQGIRFGLILERRAATVVVPALAQTLFGATNLVAPSLDHPTSLNGVSAATVRKPSVRNRPNSGRQHCTITLPCVFARMGLGPLLGGSGDPVRA